MPTHDRIQLYDSHAHLVSADLARYPLDPILPDPSTPSRYGGGIVGRPGGMHGPNPVNEKPTAEQMRGWLAEEGVVAMAAVQKGMIYGTDNSYILDSADRFPDEMRAIVIVDPDTPDALQQVRDYAKRNIVAIRFFGINIKDKVAWLSSPAALAVWALADELGLLVDVEAPITGGHVLIPVTEAMADRFPKLRIVLDHIFLPEVTEPDYGIGTAFAGLAARENISVKFTSINMDIAREQGVSPEAVLRRAVDVFGADRVMWGSDIGTSSGTYKELVARAFDAAKLLSEVERHKVLHDTGRRILTGWTGRD